MLVCIDDWTNFVLPQNRYSPLRGELMVLPQGGVHLFQGGSTPPPLRGGWINPWSFPRSKHNSIYFLLIVTRPSFHKTIDRRRLTTLKNSWLIDWIDWPSISWRPSVPFLIFNIYIVCMYAVVSIYPHTPRLWWIKFCVYFLRKLLSLFWCILMQQFIQFDDAKKDLGLYNQYPQRIESLFSKFTTSCIHVQQVHRKSIYGLWALAAAAVLQWSRVTQA